MDQTQSSEAGAMPKRKSPAMIISIVAAVVLVGAGGSVTFFLNRSIEHDGEPAVTALADESMPSIASWKEVTAPPNISLHGHALAVAYGKLWVIGGTQGTAVFSFDGQEWRQEGNLQERVIWNSAGVLQDRIFVFGGMTNSFTPTSRSPVQSSDDGMTWKTIGSLPGTRYITPMINFQDQLWSVGGLYRVPSKLTTNLISKKIFRSGNGTSWTEIGDNALPVATMGHALAAFHGKLWMLGGGMFDGYGLITPGNAVYATTDGRVWELMPALPHLLSETCAVVYDDRLWVIGGKVTGTQKTNTVYSSADGKQWKEERALPGEVFSNSCTVYRGAMFVVGGGKVYQMGEMTE